MTQEQINRTPSLSIEQANDGGFVITRPDDYGECFGLLLVGMEMDETFRQAVQQAAEEYADLSAMSIETIKTLIN